MQIRQLTVPDKTLFTLTQTFRYLNCCCNFFLYSATSSLFRRELREIFQCTNSSIKNSTKDSTILQTGPITRTRTSSSPGLHSTIMDNTTAERRKLLIEKTVENVNLALTSTEPTNGHAVSFKTESAYI
jgi:hypothetical protein